MLHSNFAEFCYWLLGLRRRYRVAGVSMQPLLSSGDEVLVDPRAYRRQSPRIGDIVVAQHPVQPGLQIIKRVATIDALGIYHLQGDNPDPSQSSDSRVPAGLILGRVTSLFANA